MWDLITPTRNQTCAFCLGSTESSTLDLQGSPIKPQFLNFQSGNNNEAYFENNTKALWALRRKCTTFDNILIIVFWMTAGRIFHLLESIVIMSCTYWVLSLLDKKNTRFFPWAILEKKENHPLWKLDFLAFIYLWCRRGHLQTVDWTLIWASLFFLSFKNWRIVGLCVLITAIQQSDSVIHIYAFFFKILFSIMVYHKILTIALCAIQ